MQINYQDNLNTIIDILEKKIEPTLDMGYQLIDEKKIGKSVYYRVLFKNDTFEINIPPAIIKEKENMINIYNYEELSIYLGLSIKKNKFIKISNTSAVFSIDDSFHKIYDEFIFGIEYEIIQMDSKKKKIPFKDFFKLLYSNKEFPKNIKYYELYCKNNIENFKYIDGIERFKFEKRINKFIIGNYNIQYFIGNRGVGKTTTILNRFYSINCPFFYINLKYFEKSENALESSLVIDEEKNNLFRTNVLEYIYLFDLEKSNNINYKKEIFDSLKYIDNLNFENNNNDKKIRNDFIYIIIKIIYLLYNYLILAEKNDCILEKDDFIKENIDNIILKIKILSKSDFPIKNDYYNPKYLINRDNLYQLMEDLKKYRAYNNYLLLNDKLPKYEGNNIWHFIEELMEKCKEINLKFVLILDQYKNLKKDQNNLEKLIKQYKYSKIFVCSSIDDYNIRYAILKGFPNYIYFQNDILSFEEIDDAHIFKNCSNAKKKVLELFKNNMREIIECMNLEDNKLNDYINKKIDRIKDYFHCFCSNDILRIFYSIYIYKNINCYWEYKDFYQIMNYIPFKYFTYEKVEKKNSMFEDINNKNYIKHLEIEDQSIDNEGLLKQKEKNKYYYKIIYSIPIAENSLFKYIKDENNIVTYEHMMKHFNKNSGKGDIFEEFIKSKIKKREMIPIKDMTIDENIEIWSLFSGPSKSSNTFGLFTGKLKEKKIYFIDIRKQNEPMFDCVILDLKSKTIFFIQITISKDTSYDVFERKKIIEYGEKALEFLKRNLIPKHIKLEIGFFFIFLKYNIENIDKIWSNEELKSYEDMKKTNKNLKDMVDECEQQNLAYCIYNISGILSKDQSNVENEYNIIDQDNNNLYISKNINKNIKPKEDEQNKTLSEKFPYMVKKRKYSELIILGALKEIALNNNPNIKLCYDFYCSKFNLGKPKIVALNGAYDYTSLEFNCKSDKCFGVDFSNNGNDNNIIYYDQGLRIYNLTEKKNKDLSEDYKKKTFRLFLLGYDFQAKVTLLDSEPEANIFAQRKTKKDN